MKRAGDPDVADADRSATGGDDEARSPAAQAEPRPITTADEPRPRRIRPASAAPVAARKSGALGRRRSPPRRSAASMPGTVAIVELRLPGLDGKPVSLADIDADFILLDFWGSWCRECRKSIEHHREIQEQLGGKTAPGHRRRLREGRDLRGRRDAAAAAARKFGINYPVLVTSMDGACPVQKALQVQFYPSMVLLDREGNILQFEQGATDTTLGRIDRAIAKAVRDGDRRDGD